MNKALFVVFVFTLGGHHVLQAQEAAAQASVPLDRWLVATEVEGSITPARIDTQLGSAEAFAPQRLERAGPAVWRLAREDGAAVLPLADPAGGPEGDVLAHAYLRTSRATDARLTLGVGCGTLHAWLNGQRIATDASSPGVDRTVRLRFGWNSLLVRVADASACSGETGGEVRALLEPDVDPARIQVQASRPPGYRAGLPPGRVLVEDVAAAPGLRWDAGSNRLSGYVDVAVSAWGRSAGDPAAEGESSPREAPRFDLTGDWNLRMTSPGGIQRSTAVLEMDPDGTLNGALQPIEDEDERGRRAFSGELRNGVVSGAEVRFEVQFQAPRGRSTDVEFEGTATEDSIVGSIRLGQIGGFESRFVAVRAGTPGAEDMGEAEAGGAGAGAPSETDRPSRRVPGLFPGSARTTNESLRARIRRQLTPAAEPPAPAPDGARVRVDVGGHDLDLQFSGLEPGMRVTRRLPVPLRRMREAARDREVEVEWEYVDGEGDRFEPEADLPFGGAVSDGVPDGPIDLGGWIGAGERSRGRFEVPDALDDTIIEILGAGAAEWRIDGAAPERSGDAWLLCDPCRRGQRLEIEAPTAADAGQLPQVRVLQENRSD